MHQRTRGAATKHLQQEVHITPVVAAGADTQHTPRATAPDDKASPPARKRKTRGSNVTGQPVDASAAGTTDSLVSRAVPALKLPLQLLDIDSNDMLQPLLDLGHLVSGKLIKRPSSTIKTPYVADVLLEDGSQVLAHAPSMDCAGMVAPGAKVYMTANSDKSTAKTSHAIQVVDDLRNDDGSCTKVGYHPFLAERLTQQLLARGLLAAQLGSIAKLEKQKTFGSMRVDFLLHHDQGAMTLLEVKNVVCADFPLGSVPAGRPKVGVYTSSKQPYEPTAIFPHGSKKAGVKVVSDRAIKHVHELTELQKAGQDETGRPVRCAILFLVNRSDCTTFRPCHEADMLFAQVLRRASEEGVKVLAMDVSWLVGKALPGKNLPVVFDDAVRSSDIDQAFLQEVFDFNANDPRKAYSKSKKRA